MPSEIGPENIEQLVYNSQIGTCSIIFLLVTEVLKLASSD